jgi:uncharacterized protein YodC (DUF2158 family)
MAQEFKIGDVVKLKSFSPKMTVTAFAEQLGTKKCWCCWFDGTKKFEGDFPPDALELA